MSPTTSSAFDPFSADYADIEAIFTDPETFSAAIAQDPVFPLAEQARTALRDGGFRAGATMSNCDWSPGCSPSSNSTWSRS